MFNLNTFSDQLDKIEKDSQEAKEQERLYRERCEQKREIEIRNMVNYEFNKAVAIVGPRLMMKSSHATYYAFCFRGINTYYQTRIYANTNKGVLSDWDITESYGHVGYCAEKIALKNLGAILISWVKENLEKDNIQVD
jgi:hypothetical protein